METGHIIQGQGGDFRPLAGKMPEDLVGVRLDSVLAQRFPFLTRSQWRLRIEAGTLRVNGRVCRPSYRVMVEDTFDFFHPLEAEPDIDRGIYPIWKEGAVMAVYKPGNLPMHENGPYRKNTFAALVQAELGKEWAAVHRLDRETSGIVLCGATYPVRKELACALAARVEKDYLAIVKGCPKLDTWQETGAIGDLKESRIRIKKWITDDGLPSETHFKVIDRTPSHTLIMASPKTGRTNQIRIHAAAAGLPLVGDKLYHPDEDIFEEYFQHRGNTTRIVEATGFERLCLHAYRLRFVHPESKKWCVVESPLPEDMSLLWDHLKAEGASS